MEDAGGYLRDKLPAEYLTSGILVVPDWTEAVAAMAALTPAETDERQAALLRWYDGFMAAKLREMEEALETKPNNEPTICSPSPKEESLEPV